MPFQSEKQRRYMHANLPKIANRWEQKYGLGGIAEQNAQLNQLPEYYLPVAQGGRIGFAEGPKTYEAWLDYRIKEIAKGRLPQDFKSWKKGDIKMNQGGFIPAHQAGVLGLAEGGRTGFQYGSPHEEAAASYAGTHAGENAARDTPSQAPDQGGHSRFDVGSGYYGEPTTPSTPKDDGDGPINIHDDTIEVIEEQKKTDEINRQNALRRMVLDRSEKTEPWEKDQQWNKPKTSWLKKIGIGAAVITGVAPLLGIKAPGAIKTIAELNALHNKTNNALRLFNKVNNTNHTLESLFNEVKNIETVDKKLLASLPKGHPERIALETKMNIKTLPTDDKDGTNIKIEDIETVNKTKTDKAKDEEYLKMQRASYLWYLEQQKRRQAYLDNYRQMFLANKGGLAGLFRVKNT